MAYCEEMNVIPLLHGKTATRPCTNFFPHLHMRNGKPVTRDFVVAKPLEEKKPKTKAGKE